MIKQKRLTYNNSLLEDGTVLHVRQNGKGLLL